MAILDTELILAFAIILLLSSATSLEDTECAQTHYVEIGTRGLIPCPCNGSSVSLIAWVNVNEGKSLLLLHDDDKLGDGYTSREYDIYPNGSLVINNVTASHESEYRVSTAISTLSSRISKIICVHTTVKPAITTPVVEECSNTYGTTCVKSTTDSVEVNCFVRDSRPAVKLSWSLRTHGGDHILPANYLNFTMDNVTYTSHVTATFSFGESSVLSLLACRANSVPLNLVEDENVLLIEKEMHYTSLANPIRRYLKIHSPMNLSCTDLGLNVVIWKWSPQQDAFKTLYVSIFEKSNHTKISNREYKLENEGSLSLQNTLVEHEGLYACVYDNGVSGGIVLYDVLVMVDPTPIFPVIDGCNHQQYCVLEKQPRDDLTCSVLGIRPKVVLEWRAFQEEIPIDFTQHQLTVTQMGDLYDISLTVNFDFTQATQNKVTVECRAVGENAELFSLSTKVDLLFPNVLPTEQRSYPSTITIIAVVVTMMIIITAAVVIICRMKARKTKVKRTKRSDLESEGIPMMANTNEKKNDLIKYAKIAYQKQYGTAKPFPSMNERSVDSIFVEGGIYYVAQKGDSKQNPDVLESLESYNEILSSPKTESKRKIIEGEPGYGKSTIGLQFLHDWCTKNPTSPLKDVKILIYLQLRQLVGVKSIYTAIKNFIVPKDEVMDEACIQEILRVYKESVVMIFDSYDEYSDKNETETDISSIIEMKMFQDSIVMILTRTLNLPPRLHPETKSFRLTGFGVAERRNYVLKVVGRNNGQLADWIEEQLQRNPVLKDLCQVPLLFTMVAHTVHNIQNIEVFNSLTKFFKYLIACFHNHMKSKNDANTEVPAFETKLANLHRIAFDGLTQSKQQLSWKTTYLVSELGQEFYDYYIDLGMLAQEEVFDILQCIHLKEARMSHKIICEFYASHHLAWILSEGAVSAASSINVKETLNSINPLDLQYIYRFACGLNKSAADIIIKHLSETKEGRQFAILCTLEQEEKSDQFLQSVKDLVSSSIAIKPHDSKLLQKSTIQVLEVASANQIPITSVCLNKSFKECEKDVIVLHSGLRLNQLLTVEKIHIETEQVNKEPRILTEEDVTMIFRYGLRSEHLKDLSFDNCLLPPSFASESIPAEMKSRDIKVSWRNYGYSLNLQSGAWKVDDVDTVKRICTRQVDIRRDDSEVLQRCSIQLLENASHHDIPISQLVLEWSSCKVDKGDIVLQSGLCLPILSTLEKLLVAANSAELTEEDVIGLLNYGVQSRIFKELRFYQCKLPTSISPEMIPETARSRNIKVHWPENTSQLDLQSGKWKQAEDIQTIRELCSNAVFINNKISQESQKSTIELLKKASRRDIPIFSVVLAESFNKVDEDDITLYSGLSLPILTSIERMSILTENGREMNKHEVNGILNYLQHSQRFKQLYFGNCLLPPTIASSSLANLKARNVYVFWIPYGVNERHFHLDLQSGRWLLNKDPESFFPMLKRGEKLTDADYAKEMEFRLPGGMSANSSSLKPISDNLPSNPLQMELLINKDGGVLELPGTGVSLEIPPGALEKDRLIQMRIIPYNFQGDSDLSFSSNSSVVVELLPSNLKLLKPVNLTLPHCLVLKKGCEWKAKIYSSHHGEGNQPVWRPQPNTPYVLTGRNCVIKLKNFSWEKFDIGDEIVEGKHIVLYAAKDLSSSESITLIHVGYYLDLPGGEKNVSKNAVSVLVRQSAVFFKPKKLPLTCHFIKIKPPDWTYDPEEKQTKELTFERVATCTGGFCIFGLNIKEGTQERHCECHFKAGQGSELVELRFLLQNPSLISHQTIRGEAIGNPVGAEAMTKDGEVVTNETLQDLSGNLNEDWRDVGRELKLEETDLCNIEANNRNKGQKEVIYQMLLLWKLKHGMKATNKTLRDARRAAGQQDLHDKFLKFGKFGTTSDLQSGRWLLNKDPDSIFHMLKHGEELTDADYANEVEAFRNRYSAAAWRLTYHAS